MNEEEIFHEALAQSLPEERSAYLDRACAGHPALRAAVEALLRANVGASGFMDSPAPSLVATMDEPIPERSGTVIGPYKLLEQIGEGGFGVVFMAEQTQPVRRKVALKVLKPGMDTRQVIARFEAERQALAIMDHPNIAKVLDGGATATGRPFFVMELVKGVPVTEFSDKNHLTPRQRLELFVPVCRAVQHAHQKGIIHRDLKPSNVLVSLHDTTPVVKVIDFGVAKALGQELTDKTLFTGFAQMIGTPLYMSPEQAGQSGLDIDTRSDIYSLGVLLYELLTGTTPFDKERLRTVGYDEICRIIREEEPPRPSTRISTLGQAATTASANRQSDTRRLSQLFRGELDWIVMKALEKDRNRRYESASSFAADVQRYLHDEPVQACPPSAGYRLRKFARRNKTAMTTAAALVLAALLAVGSFAVSYLRIEESLQHEKQAKDELVQALYYQSVASAAHERTKNRPALAEELLEQCPPRLRGWEWHYVKRWPFAGSLKLLHENDAAVHRVAWSPDHRLLASGSLDGRVKVWDARTGAELVRLEAHKKFVRSLAFSPDSRFLATGGEDDKVKLWDVNRPDSPIREFRTGRGTTMVQVLEFSPDGRQLAGADSDRKVRLWNVADGSEVFFPDDLLMIGGLAFTPDGRQLLTVNTGGVVKVWDVAARQSVATFRTDARAAGYRAAFSSDRRLLALGCEDGTVKVIRTEPLEDVRTLEAHVGEVTGVAFGAGDRRLASAGEDLTVKVWDLGTGQQSLSLDIVQRRANGLAFSPDGHRLAVGSGEGTVQILDGTPLAGLGDAGQIITLEGHGHAVVGLEYSPDGRRLVSASRDGTAKVWDAGTGRELLTFHGHQAALTKAAWTSDGRCVASASWDGTVRVWDQSTGVEVFPALDARVGPVYGLAFNGEGSVLSTAHHDGSVRVWDVSTGQVKVLIPHAHTIQVLGVAFGSSEYLATAGGGDNTIKIWNWQANTEKPIQTFVAPRNITRNPTFSPDGKYLAAVVAMPARVWMWDRTTREETTRLLPQAWKVSQAIFRPGGRLAVVSGGRIDFLERDLSDGPSLIGCHAGEICCAAFSPDGGRLATGAGYKGWGEVRIWDTSRWEKTP
jgi:WD40 repeat protein/serine/threonine protein kinase